jgi:PHP family Zn ribbon phosphoesterase
MGGDGVGDGDGEGVMLGVCVGSRATVVVDTPVAEAVEVAERVAVAVQVAVDGLASVARGVGSVVGVLIASPQASRSYN